jgi:hypothetical protein
MATSTAPFKHVHIVMGRTPLDAIEPPEYRFRAAPGELLVKSPQPCVIAVPANPVLKVRGISEFAERSRKNMFQGVTRR